MKVKRIIFTTVALGAGLLATVAPASAAPVQPAASDVECYPASFFASLSGGPAKCFTRDEYWQNTIRQLGTFSAGGGSSSGS